MVNLFGDDRRKRIIRRSWLNCFGHHWGVSLFSISCVSDSCTDVMIYCFRQYPDDSFLRWSSVFKQCLRFIFCVYLMQEPILTKWLGSFQRRIFTSACGVSRMLLVSSTWWNNRSLMFLMLTSPMHCSHTDFIINSSFIYRWQCFVFLV